MKRGRSSFPKKALYGLGILVVLAVVFFVVMFFWPYPSNSDPSWSPDGTRIAFTRHSEIWVMNADGTNQIKLLDSGQCPRWSPDGTKIAFVSKTFDVWIMNTDGSNQTKLTSGSLFCIEGFRSSYIDGGVCAECSYNFEQVGGSAIVKNRKPVLCEYATQN